MSSGENTMPRPLASPLLAPKAVQIKGGHTGHRSVGRSDAGHPRAYESIQGRDRTISKEKQRNEISLFVCEIFKEDLSDRAQARKFLWEFFD